MDAENGESFLQQFYILQETSRQSNNDWDTSDVTSESDGSGSKIRRRLERLRRAAASKCCCPNCKLLLIGLLIGSLVASIALAAVITVWVKSSSRTTSTTTTSTSTTSTTTSTTSSTSTTTSTTSTTSTTTSTTSTTSTTTSTTSTTSTTTSTTSTTSTTTSTTSTTTTSVATAATVAYTPSTVTCSSTAATICVDTVIPAAVCQSYEVSWSGRCYYLDGSAGACATGYSPATNAVLTCVAANFTGKDYASTVSGNCCIWTADTYECYGMGSNCNSAGPFTSGPTVNGAGCLNAQNQLSQQLTFCGTT